MDQSTPQAAQWNALKKIVKRLPAHMAYYGSALGAVVIAGSGAEGMVSMVGNIGAGVLGGLIADVVNGEDILDDDIRQRAENAIAESNIEHLLTERDFWRAYVQLIRRLDEQKAASQDIIDELRDGLVVILAQLADLRDELHDGLSKVATSAQLEEFAEKLLQSMGDKKHISKPRVFISYRRSDASEFAKRLHDALEAADIDAWLDVRDMPSGDAFIAQIDRAIDAADYFLLVGTPQAIDSDYCRDEWKKAIEKYKPIIPVMLMGEYKDLPQEAYAYLNDARDFRDGSQFDAQVAQLVKQVQVRPAPAGEARGLPSLPSHYLPRPELLATLRHALTQHKTTVLTSPSQKVGVQGMGGVGKSVLAMALARDYFVRRTFKDGIFWLTIGTAPRLFDVWTQLAGYLGFEGKSFKDAKEAQDFFEQATQGKEILLILDDIWESTHAEAFLHLGENCRLFASSRQDNILRAIDAHTYAIGILSHTEAEALLKRVAKVDVPPAQGNGIIHACGNLPLAIAMIGAMVQGKRETYWRDALDALEEADLEGIAARFPEYPHANLFLALKVSIDALDAELRERYYDFAIFPDDVAIPEEVPLTFWKPAKARDVRKKLDELLSRNLLTRADDGTLSLHDLQLSYLRREVQDKPARNNRLLSQYHPKSEAWWDVCDAYLWKYLAYHLREAGKLDTLRALLLDYRWLQSKLSATDVNALIEDCEYLADDDAIRLLKSALSMSAHVLREDKAQWGSQLVGRLMGWRNQDIDIKILTDRIATQVSGIYPQDLDSSYFSHDQAGGALLRVLTGHTHYVKSAVFSQDGKFIVSGSWDHTVRVWDVHTGETLRILTGHTDFLHSANFGADGMFIVSASGSGSALSDDTVRVWDAHTGDALRTLKGHTDLVTSAVFSVDGQLIVSASEDKTVRIWNAMRGQLIATLSGHKARVTSAVFSVDGQLIVSASEDKTVRLWVRVYKAPADPPTWRPLNTLLEHRTPVFTANISADSRFIVTGSADSTVQVWDVHTGEALRTLRGHTEFVNSANFSADGRFIVSASSDGTIRIWDVHTGEALRTLRGHTEFVNSANFSTDGRFIVSASNDKTLRIWDVHMGETLHTLTRHSSRLDTVVYSPNGRQIISTSSRSLDNAARVWDAASGVLLHTFPGQMSAAYSPDGRHIISVSGSYVRVWDATNFVLLHSLSHYAKHYANLRKAVYSPDGQRIISISDNLTAKIWDAASGKLLHTFLDGFIDVLQRVAYSPDGQHIVSVRGKAVKIWAADSGALLHVLRHNFDVAKAVYSQDGQYIVSEWQLRDKVSVWDAHSGTQLTEFQNTSEGRCALLRQYPQVLQIGDSTFRHANGRVLEFDDQDLNVYDGKRVYAFHGQAKIKCASWAPDGENMVVGDEQGRVLFLRVRGRDT